MLGYSALAITSIADKSATFDEVAHVAAGYSYWLRSDYRLHPENGVLVQRWLTLPLIGRGYRFPGAEDEAWRRADVWTVGRRFLYESGNDFEDILTRARIMSVLLGAGLAVTVFAWSRALFGPLGGLLSATLFACSPTMLAHGRLATSDMAAALMFTLALATLWSALHHVSIARVTASTLAMGALFAIKTSAVLLVPAGLMLIALRSVAGPPMILEIRHRRVARSTAARLSLCTGLIVAHAVGTLLVIWLAYGFQARTFAADASDVADVASMYRGFTFDSLAEDVATGPALRALRATGLLPEPYLHGLAFSLAHAQARLAFFRGEFGIGGWATFFPYAALVKTPIGTTVLLLAALGALATRLLGPGPGRRRRAGRLLYRTAPLWIFGFVYAAAALDSGLNIGHRHLLPLYPLAFVLCGAAIGWVERRRRAMSTLMLIALLASALDSWLIRPHYLAYFNALAGGPRQGYRHLVDSSLDWGQDLPALEKRVERWRSRPTNHQRAVYLSYFGSAMPPAHGLSVIALPSHLRWQPSRNIDRLGGGLYCISATMLHGVYTEFPTPWRPVYERLYRERRRQMLAIVLRLEASGADGTALDPSDQRALAAFDDLRFARLSAYLRLREPDDFAGFSILLYDLDDTEVMNALLGPPPYPD